MAKVSKTSQIEAQEAEHDLITWKLPTTRLCPETSENYEWLVFIRAGWAVQFDEGGILSDCSPPRILQHG